MSEKIKVCIIGAGNISNTRHIPALKKLNNVEIVGVISDKQEKIDKTCQKHNIENGLLVNNPTNDLEKVKKCKWFKEVQAVIIGTPPKQHYPLVKLALTLEKDVLVEKPMTMNDWIEQLDYFLKMSRKDILTGSGTVSHIKALEHARKEYKDFSKRILTNPTENEKLYFDKLQQLMLIDKKD